MYPDTGTLIGYKKNKYFACYNIYEGLKKKKKANLKKPDKKDHILWLYLYKMPRRGNSIKTESKLVIVYDIP